MRSRLRTLRTPFVSALLGGLVVGAFGWVAIAAGWVTADDDEPAPLATAPATEPVANEGTSTGVNEIYRRTSPGVVLIEATRSGQAAPVDPFGQGGGGTATGSGFVIDGDGHIITNAHVVDGADDIEVTAGEDGEPLDAKVVGQDPSTDIAVLDVQAPEDTLTPLALGKSSEVVVGDPVIAIGSPFGLDGTVTAGIVSATERDINAPNRFTISDAIQTDAPINPGNSGGPLLDATGRVIGVNSQIESQSGGNVGIGFAVPIDTVRDIAQQLIDDGEVQHAFLGISGIDLTAEIAEVLNLQRDEGALVQSVIPDSPADEAGLEVGDAEMTLDGRPVLAGGDIIVAVDGDPVSEMVDVIDAVDSKQPGDEIELTLLRAGEERDVTLELGNRPANRGR